MLNRFIVVPLVAIIIAPGIIYDSNGLPKLIALLFGTFVLVLKTRFKWDLKLFQLLPFLLLFVYLANQISRPIDLSQFMLGSATRNGGFVAIFCLSIIYWCSLLANPHEIDQFYKILNITYVLLIVLAFAQKAKLLPDQIQGDFEALNLSLGNPNFASAFMAVLISVHIVRLIQRKSDRNPFSYALLFLAFITLTWTNSLQGYLILLTSLIIVSLKYMNKIFRIQKGFFIFLSVAVFLFLLSILFINNPFRDFLFTNGSVKQRLSYWDLAIKIFIKYPWQGVGLDNFRSEVTQNRSLSLVLQEGMFTVPDRAHNVVLDHFVNGGVFAGLFWLTFILIVTFHAIRIIIFDVRNQKDFKYLWVLIVWSAYLIQSLISVDHLALTTLGYISAGLILGPMRKFEDAESNKILSTVKNVNINRASVAMKSFTITTIAFLAFYAINFIPAEKSAAEYLYKGKTNELNKLLSTGFIAPQTLEKVAVTISNKKEFELANKFADKLLIKRPYSHQAFFIKSVYSEYQKNNSMALYWMNQALASDPWNSVYLVSKAIILFNLGQTEQANLYVKKTREVNPNQQGLEVLENRLSSRST